MKIAAWIWNHLEEFLLLPILAFSTSIVFLQVIMRYCFNNALPWVEELARYLFVWQMWLGVSYAARNRTHLRITMLTDRFPPRLHKVVELLVLLLWIGFSVFIAFKGVEMMKSIIRYHQVSAALQLPMQYAYMAVPVGAGLMALRLIEVVIKDYFSGRKRPEETGKEAGA